MGDLNRSHAAFLGRQVRETLQLCVHVERGSRGSGGRSKDPKEFTRGSYLRHHKLSVLPIVHTSITLGDTDYEGMCHKEGLTSMGLNIPQPHVD